jgi:hypothetical protein
MLASSTIKALEEGALDVYGERSISSSIGGRLGGSIRTSKQIRAVLDEEEAATEEELLLKREVPAKAPPLLVWIFPALLCAAGKCVLET